MWRQLEAAGYSCSLEMMLQINMGLARFTWALLSAMCPTPHGSEMLPCGDRKKGAAPTSPQLSTSFRFILPKLWSLLIQALIEKYLLNIYYEPGCELPGIVNIFKFSLKNHLIRLYNYYFSHQIRIPYKP